MLRNLSLEQFWKKHPAVSFLCADDSTYIVYDKVVTKFISVSKQTAAPITLLTYKENQLIPIEGQVKLNCII